MSHLAAGAGFALAVDVDVGAALGDEVHGWEALLRQPGTHVHIYGKGEARPGRKMGHVTTVQPSRE